MEICTSPTKLKELALDRQAQSVPQVQKSMLKPVDQALLDPLNFMLPLWVGVMVNPKSHFEVAIAAAEDIAQHPSYRPTNE